MSFTFDKSVTLPLIDNATFTGDAIASTPNGSQFFLLDSTVNEPKVYIMTYDGSSFNFVDDNYKFTPLESGNYVGITRYADELLVIKKSGKFCSNGKISVCEIVSVNTLESMEIYSYENIIPIGGLTWTDNGLVFVGKEGNRNGLYRIEGEKGEILAIDRDGLIKWKYGYEHEAVKVGTIAPPIVGTSSLTFDRHNVHLIANSTLAGKVYDYNEVWNNEDTGDADFNLMQSNNKPVGITYYEIDQVTTDDRIESGYLAVLNNEPENTHDKVFFYKDDNIPIPIPPDDDVSGITTFKVLG